MVVAAVFGVPLAFLTIVVWFEEMNKQRKQEVAWGDCCLRATTRALRVAAWAFVAECVVGGIAVAGARALEK